MNQEKYIYQYIFVAHQCINDPLYHHQQYLIDLFHNFVDTAQQLIISN